MKKNIKLDEYVEEIVKSVQAKLKARETDVLGILGEETALTDAEMVAYKHYLLEADVEAKQYAELRYFSGKKVTYKAVAEDMGVSEGKVYYVRRRFLDGVNEALREFGYGYEGDE